MFDESIDREWYRCLRAGKPLALLLIDVDFFKKYNDAYGHVAGDECLRRVAGAIAACVMRPSDLCARYGGEEFAVLLPETAIDGARVLAEHICGAVRALGMEHASAPSGVVSVSIGVAAVVPAADGTVAGAIESADAALYRAKERGRDRVEIADASAETGGIIRRS
jgi:diguanylate cyclase (GGDEF)-like protein